MEFMKYLSGKNVNVLLNIGMGCVIIHLFYEINKLKKQVKLLQSLNSPKKLTLDDVKDKENIDLSKSLENEKILSQPILAPTEMPVDNVKIVAPIRVDNEIKTEKIKMEHLEQTELNIPEISELKADESEIPIYSNDNDELMSIEMTDKMSEKETILSEISTTSVEKTTVEEEKADEAIEVKAVEKTTVEEAAVEEAVEETVVEEAVVEEETNVETKELNDDSETKSDINKDELMKMKKNDILKLASEFKLSVVKDNNGKVKKKTKSELVEDILSANN
jgi:hypothetical protein